MADEIDLLEQLEGPFENALFLTYSLTLPFFETWIWPRLHPRCRNRIVLADRRRFLEEMGDCAASGLLRHLGRAYPCSGVAGERAVHAKVVLLTSPDRGRLLVGSGNLTRMAYTSGGELYVRYDYSPSDRSWLNGFRAVREIIERFVEDSTIDEVAAKRVRYLLEHTSWLYDAPVGDERPVRHNLHETFVRQVVDAVGDEVVDELTLMAPFHDAESAASAELLRRLRPTSARILVQPDVVSASPTALQSVVDAYPSCSVVPFRKGDAAVHAKLVLVRTPTRTVCLEGSPNLSAVALLRTYPEGNLEVANLSSGPPSVYDGVLGALSLEAAVECPGQLQIAFREPEEEPARPLVHLISGSLRADVVRLRCSQPPPELDGPALTIDGREVSGVVRIEGDLIQMRLAEGVSESLRSPRPVRVVWAGRGIQEQSNPIFVSDLDSLDRILMDGDGQRGDLSRFGDLDVADEEIVDFLGSVQRELLLDPGDLAARARRSLPEIASEDEVRMALKDIDWDSLRQHPSFSQYRFGAAGSADSPLQILLRSVSAHFAGRSAAAGDAAMSSAEGDAVVAGEDEAELDEDERARRAADRLEAHRSALARAGVAFRTFFRRHLRGASSPSYRDRVGPEVMAQHYGLVQHLHRLLLTRSYLGPVELIKTGTEIWTAFWDYYATLPRDERAPILEWLRSRYHHDASIIAGLVLCDRLCALDHIVNYRVALSAVWRRLLVGEPGPELTPGAVAEAVGILERADPLTPSSPESLLLTLTQLAYFETMETFVGRLRAELQLDVTGDVRSVRHKVRRADGREHMVDVLMIPSLRPFKNPAIAWSILRRWRGFQPGHGYFRIQHVDQAAQAMCYWDDVAGSGMMWCGGDPDEVSELPEDTTDWAVALGHLGGRDTEIGVDRDVPSMGEAPPVARHLADV